MKWSNACLYIEIYPGYSRTGCYKLRLQKNSKKPEVGCFNKEAFIWRSLATDTSVKKKKKRKANFAT